MPVMSCISPRIMSKPTNDSVSLAIADFPFKNVQQQQCEGNEEGRKPGMTPQNAQCGQKAPRLMRNGCHHQCMPAKACSNTL